MSYQNQHSLSQPYWNFLPSSLIFYPHEICLIVAFVFSNWLATMQPELFFKWQKKMKSETLHPQKKRTYNPQSTTKKQILLTVSNLSLKHNYEVCLNLTPIVTETVSTNFILSFNPKEKKYATFEISHFCMKGLEKLLKYDLALPQMILSSFHCHFKVCSSKATMS